MKKQIALSIISSLSVLTIVFLSNNALAVSTPNFYESINPYEAVTKSNGGNTSCVATGDKLSSQDWQDGKYNIKGEAILPQEMIAQEGWSIWKCWPNDKKNTAYLCASNRPDGYDGESKAVCSDNEMRPESDINRIISQIKGEVDPDDPYESSYNRYVSDTSYINAAQKSNNGDATCAEQYILIAGRIDCWNSSNDKYWSCYQVQSTSGYYEVDCDEDNWTSEPPDYSGYPNPGDTTPSRVESLLSPTCEDTNGFGWFFCKAGEHIAGAIDAMIKDFLLPMLQWRIMV